MSYFTQNEFKKQIDMIDDLLSDSSVDERIIEHWHKFYDSVLPFYMERGVGKSKRLEKDDGDDDEDKEVKEIDEKGDDEGESEEDSGEDTEELEESDDDWYWTCDCDRSNKWGEQNCECGKWCCVKCEAVYGAKKKCKYCGTDKSANS